MREYIQINERLEVCIDDQDHELPIGIEMPGAGQYWSSRREVKNLRKAIKKGLRITRDLEPGT